MPKEICHRQQGAYVLQVHEFIQARQEFWHPDSTEFCEYIQCGMNLRHVKNHCKTVTILGE